MDLLSLPGTLDSLQALNKYVVDAANAAGLAKKPAYNLRLAADEVMTNIILHGYEENGLTGNVDIKADIDDDKLTITVEDTAVAYNPFDTPEVQQEELNAPLESKKMGGLGVYLTLRSVDQFLYERVDNKNRNIFIVNRVPS